MNCAGNLVPDADRDHVVQAHQSRFVPAFRLLGERDDAPIGIHAFLLLRSMAGRWLQRPNFAGLDHIHRHVFDLRGDHIPRLQPG
jgi:hypothetical protein